MRHPRGWTVGVGVAALAVAGAVAAQHWATRPVPVPVTGTPLPVTATAGGPATATVTWVQRESFCAVTSPLTDHTGNRDRTPRVDPDADRARLGWLPGTNATRADCHPDTIALDAPAAGRLAREVNDSTAVPDGPRSCPADVGLSVLVSLRSARGWQTVQVDTTGCTALTAAGFRRRQPGADLLTDLADLAPATWARTAP